MPRPIEIVSDVVCPWCFVGKRRLEKALALLGLKDVPVVWKPFELNPDAPKAGLNRAEYRARKFGSAEYARQLESRVAMAGAGEGIEFRFDRIAKLPNTFDAHRLIWLAGSGARQDAVVEKLFHAYFIKGEDVGDPVVLTRIGLEAGLDRNSIDQLFHTNLAAEEVRSEERLAIAQGVGGVPSFFLEGELIASGAQAPELLARSLAPALLGEGTQCSVDGPCA